MNQRITNSGLTIPLPLRARVEPHEAVKILPAAPTDKWSLKIWQAMSQVSNQLLIFKPAGFIPGEETNFAVYYFYCRFLLQISFFNNRISALTQYWSLLAVWRDAESNATLTLFASDSSSNQNPWSGGLGNTCWLNFWLQNLCFCKWATKRLKSQSLRIKLGSS